MPKIKGNRPDPIGMIKILYTHVDESGKTIKGHAVRSRKVRDSTVVGLSDYVDNKCFSFELTYRKKK